MRLPTPATRFAYDPDELEIEGFADDGEPGPVLELPQPAKGIIYIAGPWRGLPDGNKASFASAEKLLLSDGWTVRNPHTLNEVNGVRTDQPIEDAIRFDYHAILEADAICLLPGWRASEGVRVHEAPMAKSLRLDFYTAWEENGNWYYKPIPEPEAAVNGIDQTARSYVYGQRAQTYGHPRNDFAIIAGMWRAILKGRVEFLTPTGRIEDIDWDAVMTDEVVSICMSALKLARLVKSPGHRDSQVDVCGYMLTLSRLQESPEEIAAWNAEEPK
jgi:Domain of unknown function (DUF6378)/Domain of unknown function (DUF4406)